MVSFALIDVLPRRGTGAGPALFAVIEEVRGTSAGSTDQKGDGVATRPAGRRGGRVATRVGADGGQVARLVRDVGLAEDLAQDALVAALDEWPRRGMPPNPGRG